MSTKIAISTASQEPRPDIFRFAEHVRGVNPFSSDCVNDTKAKVADVEPIHHKEFQRLKALAAECARERKGAGVVVWGEAGIGKSHLLARLARWSKVRKGAFVYLLNLQASAGQWPRTVLRYVVSHLTDNRTRRFDKTVLFEIVGSVVSGCIKKSTGTRADTWKSAYEEYQDFIEEQLSRDNGVAGIHGPITYRLLFEFFRSAYEAKRREDDGYAALVVRWLSGETLDGEEAKRLHLPLQRMDEELGSAADDQMVQEILVALANIARLSSKDGQPFILCFDQVENMSEECVQAYGRFVHSLVDRARNLLVVTCGVRDELIKFVDQQLILDSSWARICGEEVRLKRIRKQEGRMIVQARIENFLTSFMEVPEIRETVDTDDLFPLGHEWLEAATEDVEDFRPRDIIGWAKSAWKVQQERLNNEAVDAWIKYWQLPNTRDGIKPVGVEVPLETLIDQKIEAKLGELVRMRQVDPAQLPESSENMAGLVLALMRQCLPHVDRYTLRKVEDLRGKKGAYSLLVQEQRADGRETKTGVLFLCEGSALAVTHALRRLREDKQPIDHVLMVTDARRPLRLGAKGKEHFDALKSRSKPDFKSIDLLFDQYAALDALLSVVGLAKSGDIEIECPVGVAHSVSADEVVASHHRRDAYRLHPLLEDLLTEPNPKVTPPAAPFPDAFNRKAGAQYLMAQIALVVGMTTKEMACKFVAENPTCPWSIDSCRVEFDEIAKELHKRGKLHAAAHEDGYFLLRTW
ncbi:MAG: AAA family ATPase [Planctomycetota bacterium]